MSDLWGIVIAAQGTQGSSTLTGADLWAPVIAALGSALLTGVVAFGLEWLRSSKAAKSARSERRTHAYSALLAQAVLVANMAEGLHITMQLRSGLGEGIHVVLGKQKPIDPLEFTNQLQAVFKPLYEAWAEVWIVGSKEAVAESNDLIAHCGSVLGVATQRGEAGTVLERIISGEKWTQKQLDQMQEEQRKLAEVRKRFAKIARKETGVEVADLFASNEQKSTQLGA